MTLKTIYLPSFASRLFIPLRIIWTDTFGYVTLRFKDYKELIEEAKLQFPDAALSEEKKHKYFIE